MKLLSPQQTKDSKAQDFALELLRTQEMRKASDQARKDLANAQADFNLALAKNNEQWVEEELAHVNRKKEMQKEIDVLEAKKLNALIPFNILKVGTDDRMKDAETFLSDLREREDNVEELTDRLENKLDEVGEREQEAIKLSQRLNLRQEGLARQEALTKERSKGLTLQMQEFASTQAKDEKAIDSRKIALDLRERSLLAQEQKLKRTDKALEALGIRLADERATLAKAWDELKRLYPNSEKAIKP